MPLSWTAGIKMCVCAHESQRSLWKETAVGHAAAVAAAAAARGLPLRSTGRDPQQLWAAVLLLDRSAPLLCQIYTQNMATFTPAPLHINHCHLILLPTLRFNFTISMFFFRNKWTNMLSGIITAGFLTHPEAVILHVWVIKDVTVSGRQNQWIWPLLAGHVTADWS